MTLDEFVQKYPPQMPRKPPDNEGQLRRLTETDGIFAVANPLPEGRVRGSPSQSQNPDRGRHLWVFFDGQIPSILEAAAVTPPLEGLVKHTNLTGGGAASSGGELWFDTTEPMKLYVNGASGRYGPKNADELNDAVSVFQSGEFEVVSVGWDLEVDKPARVIRP